MKQLEATGKALTSIYGSQMKVMDEAYARGLIGSKGIAKNTAEIAIHQGEWLRQQMKSKLVTEAQEKNEDKRNAINRLVLQNRIRTIKIVAGMAMKYVQEVHKQTEAQRNLNTKIREQLKIAKEQYKLLVLQNKIKLEQVVAQGKLKIGNAELNNMKLSVKLSKDVAKFMKEQFSIVKRINAERFKGAKLLRSTLHLQNEIRTQQQIGAGKDWGASMGRDLARMQDLPDFLHIKKFMLKKQH